MAGNSSAVGPLSISVGVFRRDRKSLASTELSLTGPSPKAPFHLVTYYKGASPQGRKRRSDVHQVISNIVNQALYRVLKALQAEGALVGCCPESSTLFLGKRTHQVYGNPTCQSRVTSRHYRKDHPPSKRKNSAKHLIIRSNKEPSHGTKRR